MSQEQELQMLRDELATANQQLAKTREHLYRVSQTSIALSNRLELLTEAFIAGDSKLIASELRKIVERYNPYAGVLLRFNSANATAH